MQMLSHHEVLSGQTPPPRESGAAAIGMPQLGDYPLVGRKSSSTWGHFFCLCLLLGLLPQLARGGNNTNLDITNFVWTGASGSLWNSTNNWLMPTNGSTPPRPPNSIAGQDFVIFRGLVSQRTIDLGNTPQNVRGMQFDAAANPSGYTFNVSGVGENVADFGFHLRPDGIVDYDSHPEIFNAPVKLLTYAGGNLSSMIQVALNVTSGGLIFSGQWSGGAANTPTFDLNGGNVVLNGSGDFTFGGNTTKGIIASSIGGGVVTMNSSGRLFLDGTSANTYSGGTFINNGTVYANKINALGNLAPLVVNNLGILEIHDFNQRVGDFILAGGTINGGAGTLLLNSASNNIQSGLSTAIIGGSGGLTKTTDGSVTFTGANTYGGGTTIERGTLFIDNSTGSGTGSGAVNVKNGGTLAGTGIITGPLTLQSGGNLSAGHGNPGTLTSGNQTWQGGSKVTLAMNSAGGTAGANPGWGVLKINGVLTLGGSPITINLTSLTLGGSAGPISDFSPDGTYDWLFASASGGIVGLTSGSFQVSTLNFANNPDDYRFSVVSEKNGTELHLTHVPEPGAIPLLLLGLGLGALAHVVRRRI